MNDVIRFHDVHLLFGRTLALDLEELRIGPGERVFVLGHSGSGKTTLSRLVKGRLRPSTGTVSVLGMDPATSDRRERRKVQRAVAMIDQEYFLVPRLRVVENVLHGCLGRVAPLRSMLGMYPDEEWQRAASILDEVGLNGLGDRRVETLSGGQRQRVAIARALMQEADVLLADEPVSALDPELADDALELLVDCATRRGVTLLVNLHQPELAKRFASRLVGLRHGRLVYDGVPESFTDEHAALVYRGDEPPRLPPGSHDDEHGPQKGVAAEGRRPRLRLVSG